ncbi:GGDEF domain-containing protein [Alteromonas flava]|uniref:GGDEF domain-containing protein n=1 Tax=Alteromonas flava TaxID=2048003 RepID=UPI000C290376|nr:diguanylate cyclase [Alteromonas flava]
MTFKALVLISTLGLLACNQAEAQSEAEVDAFIDKVKTVTYDCPDPAGFEQLERYLQSADLTQRQRVALSAEKSHFLICEGKTSEAQDLLFDLVEWDNIDKASYFYASAVYQIGFTYDVKEQPERCEYYQQAQSLARDAFSDVFLSATLGIITNCKKDLPVGERLGMMFNVLELYSASKNYQALAHIHNSIGLIYGGLQQHVLAAEQYLKAHEMGLKVYTGSNQLTILISAISSLLASGQYDRAYAAIVEFNEINQTVNTPLTNFFYSHALVGYYYRINDIDSMKRELPLLMERVNALSNPVFKAMAEWYSVVPCVADIDLVCVESYQQEFKQKPASVQRFLRQNLDYLELQVEIALLQKDWASAEAAFSEYSQRAGDTARNSQASASIHGVANLYSKIYSLESEVENAQQLKQRIIVIGGLAALLVIVVVVFYLRKRHLEKLTYDPTTNLLNGDTARMRIEQLAAPEKGKANALALLDLSNFRELTLATGLSKGNSLLRRLAQTLQNITRETDILGRYGPEQFILCLPNIEENSAKSFFDRLQTELDNVQIGEPSAEMINVRSSMSIFIAEEKLSDVAVVIDEMIMSIQVKAHKSAR